MSTLCLICSSRFLNGNIEEHGLLGNVYAVVYRVWMIFNSILLSMEQDSRQQCTLSATTSYEVTQHGCHQKPVNNIGSSLWDNRFPWHQFLLQWSGLYIDTKSLLSDSGSNKTPGSDTPRGHRVKGVTSDSPSRVSQ